MTAPGARALPRPADRGPTAPVPPAPVPVAPVPLADDADIDRLVRHIAGNRFMPVPPPHRCFVGDGDFRAIGARFLRHFVRIGGLKPADRVLDIGCGIGRMALPLTQHLDPQAGQYDGIDVVADGIRWCEETIAPVYGNFRFHHIDLANEIYNPQGRIAAATVALPFNDGAFDFIILTSVLTHLVPEETRAYAGEIARLLAPGGRCFISMFLMNDAARAGLRAGPRRPSFDPDAPGPAWLADPAKPSVAVAYDEAFLLDLFARAGLHPVGPIVHGHWSGRPGVPYQDICVFGKTPGRLA